MAAQRTYCVTHETPLVPDHLADYIIGIGDYHPQRGAHISALDAFWDRMRPYSYGAAGNYVIPLAMDAAGPTPLTGVFSHRKIIVRTQIGEPSPVLDFYHEVTTAEAKAIAREEIEPRPGFEFLIAFPLKFPSGVIEHYIETHLGIDIFEYVSMAVDMEILSLDEAQAFAQEKFFIPGGCELGVYPTAWVRPMLEKLERLGREFVTRCAPVCERTIISKCAPSGFSLKGSAHSFSYPNSRIDFPMESHARCAATYAQSCRPAAPIKTPRYDGSADHPGLVDRGVPPPVKTTAKDRLDDEVVGGAGGADADADIDLP